MTNTDKPEAVVTQADREAVDRAERYAKSLHTTPEEHDDIMVAVRLARRLPTKEASSTVEIPAGMKAFEREERYIVIKRKTLTEHQAAALRWTLDLWNVGGVECVVIESDWPEYETVWRMIEDRCTGSAPKPQPVASHSGDEAAIIEHVRGYDTPRDGDPRRRYTEAQLSTAIRLAALSTTPTTTADHDGPLDKVRVLDKAAQECRRVAAETNFAPDVTNEQRAWYTRGTQTCAEMMRYLASRVADGHSLESLVPDVHPTTTAEGVGSVDVERPSDDALDPHLPQSIRGAKRCGMERSDWLSGWFVSWSPRNDNQNAEGGWSDWVALAQAILDADAKAIAALTTPLTVDGEGPHDPRSF